MDREPIDFAIVVTILERVDVEEVELIDQVAIVGKRPEVRGQPQLRRRV